ncbi:GNAT family N-acetyltransferase [Novosphingobium lindaniclasticum]
MAAPAPMPPESTLSCLPWRALEDQIAAWDRLALRASEPNPFFESWYLLPSLRHLPDTGKVMVLLFEQAGELAGLLPVVSAPRYYRWPVPNLASWLHENCFCGVPLIARGAERDFWRAVLDWADDRAGQALFLHLRAMPVDGPIQAALAATISGEARQTEIVLREDRALLASDLSADAYLETSLSSKKRKELRRQASRLAEQGAVAAERRSDTEGLPEWCERFLALEASGWKGKAGSALANHAGTAALFRESLEGAAARGRLERLSLTLGGRPIAMLASFLTPPGAYSFKTAFDERYSRFSPGVLLQRENLDILERGDIEWSDSCAAADHPMIDHLWRERRTMARLSIAIGGPLRRRLFRSFVRAELVRNPAGGGR